jgi:hypothetical protein
MWNWITRQYNDIKGNAKWALLAVLWTPVVALAKRLLRMIPNIPDWTVWSILFVLSLIAFVWLAKRRPVANTQLQTAPPQGANQHANRVEEFYHTYDNGMLAETEENMRNIASAYPANERERFFLRFIASGILNYVFDVVWLTIYGSQIKALQKMNSRPLTREELRKLYDDAAHGFPKIYETYNFDKWVGYMRANLLVLEQGDQVVITKRGREFLKYLVHFAQPIDMKQS